MKNKIRNFITLILVVSMCAVMFVGCGKNKGGDDDSSSEKKLTQAEIETAFEDSDGTLSIEGSSDNVTAFKYVVTGISAENLLNKNYTRTAINTLLTDSSNVTMGQLMVCNGFSAVMSACALFEEDEEEEEFNYNDFVEDVLEIICDGATKTYDGWKISSTVDATANSITVSVKK